VAFPKWFDTVKAKYDVENSRRSPYLLLR